VILMEAIVVVSEEQLKQLRETQERHELEELRATLRINSLDDAKERFENVELACETMLKMAEEAYATFGEDEDDDFETAKAKADKLNGIERQHDRCIAAWGAQLRRVNWESRQAQAT
jgi:hypothetical protein